MKPFIYMPYFQKEPQSGEYTFFFGNAQRALGSQFENIDKEAREVASRYLSEAGAHFISERDDPTRAAEEAQELLFLQFYNKLISVI